MIGRNLFFYSISRFIFYEPQLFRLMLVVFVSKPLVLKYKNYGNLHYTNSFHSFAAD
jgi:hypothetical protein